MLAHPSLENKITYCDPDDPLSRRIVMRAVERLTGQPRLQRLYDSYLSNRGEGDDFWISAVSHLQLNVQYEASRLKAVPKSGPVVFIANHPFGVLDGIAIGYLVSQVRPDFKVVAHAALGRAEVFRPYLIPIAFHGPSGGLRSNVVSKRRALSHLNTGGALVIFPAGGVSTAAKTFGPATDLPWKQMTGKLIEQSNATVVPIFFEGQNGPLFHFVSKFSPAMREALILREVVRRMGQDIVARIGTPLEPEHLATVKGAEALIGYLRQEVYRLEAA